MTSPASAGADRNEVAEAVFRKLFFTAEGRSKPYPLYHALREAMPVHRTGIWMWLLSRYDDCAAMVRDPRFGKAYGRRMEQRFGAD
jgi:cytochrome P450